ncbi:hypothetical protein [Micromonospora sp. DT233]|uniref:hypothetical protein n=1 Tax=Micromonospora sp. DT233 TaxID=3393432 RepID=UPI003CF5771D
MTDLYRGTEAQSTTGRSTTQAGWFARTASDRTSVLLWVALVVSVVLNAVLSNVNVFLGGAFGMMVLACGWALVVRYRRNRNR